MLIRRTNNNSENLFSLFRVLLLVLNSFSKEPYHITKSMIKNSIVNIKHILLVFCLYEIGK